MNRWTTVSEDNAEVIEIRDKELTEGIGFSLFTQDAKNLFITLD